MLAITVFYIISVSHKKGFFVFHIIWADCCSFKEI